MGNTNSTLKASSQWNSNDTLTLVAIFIAIPGAVAALLTIWYLARRRREHLSGMTHDVELGTAGGTTVQESIARPTLNAIEASESVSVMLGNLSTTGEEILADDTTIAVQEMDGGGSHTEATKKTPGTASQVTHESTQDFATWSQETYTLDMLVEAEGTAWRAMASRPSV